MPTQIKVEATRFVADLRLLEAGIVQATHLAVRAAVAATEAAAKQTRVAKHRKVPDPIRVEWQGPRAASVTALAIQPYTITPTNARVLHFQVNGQDVFTRLVRNKGTDPAPYMNEPLRVGRQAAAYGAEFFVGEAIRRAGR